MKCQVINIDVQRAEKNIAKLNAEINEILTQNDIKILDFISIESVKSVVFSKIGIKTESEIGLESASETVYVCKGMKEEERWQSRSSFYLDEIENIKKHCSTNEQIIKYTTALLRNTQNHTMIDTDVKMLQKWLKAEKFPLAKYPSKFSPTLMQQAAINIAISEDKRKEKIFSVNGPPGTGKTTLLKEIIASNVEQQAEKLIEYGIDSECFIARKVESASKANYIEKYYEIPEDIAKFGILLVSNNNGAVENVTLDLPKADSVKKEKT